MFLRNLFGICALSFVFFSAGPAAWCEGDDVSPERLFSRGNDYYEQGQYDSAVEAYEKMADKGYESGPLYYNLAGAYFKSGRIGKAVRNYELAARFMPRDADLEVNYRFARQLITGRLPDEDGIWARLRLKEYACYFTLNELTLITSGVYVLLLIALLLAAVFYSLRRVLIITACALFLAGGLNLAIIARKINEIKTCAVIVAPSTEALFGPFDTATRFFTLYEGMKVNVVNAKDDWYKIRRQDGKVGWIKSSDADRI
ncbi:MAG: tetratricopeptide repeat protein [Candidatus Omnitrophota bacterium]